MQRVSTELERVNAGLSAEIGGDGADRDLVLTADGNRDLFPVIQAVHAERPQVVPGWTIIAFRPRAAPGDFGVRIEMGGRTVDPREVRFVATRAASKLELDVFIPGFTTTEEMGGIGFILLDHTIGEYDMETVIGGIAFAALDKAPSGARPLEELPAVVDSFKRP